MQQTCDLLFEQPLNFVKDWNFHSRLKISFPALFFCAQRGAQNEKTILDWKFHSVLKLDFLNIASRDWTFSIFGPSGPSCWAIPPVRLGLSRRTLEKIRKQNDYTHTSLLFGSYFPNYTGHLLHMAAGIILCNSGAFIRYFLQTHHLHTLIVWKFLFQLHAHLLHKRIVLNYLCNHFRPHSKFAKDFRNLAQIC